MAVKLVDGSNIKYTCIGLSREEYDRAVEDVNSSIRGFVIDNRKSGTRVEEGRRWYYQPAEDRDLSFTEDWSIDILSKCESPYMHWVIIQEHPSDVYCVMSDITQQDIYDVRNYDVWQLTASKPSELVAVVTYVDMD